MIGQNGQMVSAEGVTVSAWVDERVGRCDCKCDCEWVPM